MPETLQIRVHGPSRSPTLIYLPGLHGDWTLLGPFRAALSGRARLVEVTYPRRTDWTLDDYATAVEERLLAQGITQGWVMGESFSSQVAWPLMGRERLDGGGAFRPHGLILVGGFVRHPWLWGVRLAHCASQVVPMWLLRTLCSTYGRVAARHHSDHPEIVAELKEFARNRIAEGDREAITQRYRLIAGGDLRELAGRIRLPVFQLTGAIDPIVPWWHVKPWLKRHCPGYRNSRILWRAGHNVLLSEPQGSANQILEWILGPDHEPKAHG